MGSQRFKNLLASLELIFDPLALVPILKFQIHAREVIMLFIVSLLLAALIALTGKYTLKRHPYPCYAAALAISILVSFYQFPHGLPEAVDFFLNLFRRGALATGLWCIVMWAGALKNGSLLTKKLMPIRGELSIFAAALTLGHNIGYGKTYFVRLFTDAGSLPANQLAACIITLILLAIMLPLTIMSFPKVRRSMKAKKWKQYQRFAYLFYALIYVHIMLLFTPLAKAGNGSYYLSIIVYSFVFVGYAVCRIRKWIFLKKKPSHKREVDFISFGIFLAVIVLIAAAAAPSSADSLTASNEAADLAVEGTAQPDEKKDAVSASQASVAADEAKKSQSAGAAETKAAAEDGNTLAASRADDSDDLDTAEAGSSGASSDLKDGTYKASASGYDGLVTAVVTIEGGRITSIECSSAESDLWYFEKCKDTVVSEILKAQDTEVDTVTGATYSSNGIKKAVLKALESAAAK